MANSSSASVNAQLRISFFFSTSLPKREKKTAGERYDLSSTHSRTETWFGLTAVIQRNALELLHSTSFFASWNGLQIGKGAHFTFSNRAALLRFL